MTTDTYFQVKGRTEITVPHENGSRTFVSPPYQGTYFQVQNKIREAGLVEPTLSEIVSLAYAANKTWENAYATQINYFLRKGGLWAFTGIEYDKKEGIFIQDLPEIGVDNLPIIDRAKARRVEWDSYINEEDHKIATNPFVIALVGEVQADLIAKLASDRGEVPYACFLSHDYLRMNSPDERNLIVNRGAKLSSSSRHLFVVGNSQGKCDEGLSYALIPQAA